MVLDSNICIAYLNGDPVVISALSEWKEQSAALLISSITVAEVLSYPALAPHEIADAQLFLRGFISIPFDDALAETAAWLRRIYGIALPDAAIAATAFIRNLPLVTVPVLYTFWVFLFASLQKYLRRSCGSAPRFLTRDQRFKKIREVVVIDL